MRSSLQVQLIESAKTIALMIIYYIVGILFYHYQEGWSLNDCAYFITVSICTVGYGYFYPTSNSSRMFTVFYLLVGILFVISTGSNFARNVLVSLQNKYLESLHYSRHSKSLAKVCISLFLIFFVILVGSLVYQHEEGWSGNESFYFVVITILTIGYGDISPKKESTRTFSIFFILSCVIIFATAIHNIGDALMEAKQDRLQQLIIYSRVRRHEIEIQMTSMDSDNDSEKQTTALTRGASCVSSDINNTVNLPWYSAVFEFFVKPSESTMMALTRSEEASLQSLGQMTETEFVLDLLMRLGTVDKKRDVEPLVNVRYIDS